jgi:hypothetical protein
MGDEELREIRADIKILIGNQSAIAEQVKGIREDMAEHTRPCADFSRHIAEHEAIKAEGKGAIRWVLTTFLTPFLAALAGFLAARFGLDLPGSK